jgi:hydroxypyruvate reductase
VVQGLQCGVRHEEAASQDLGRDRHLLLVWRHIAHMPDEIGVAGPVDDELLAALRKAYTVHHLWEMSPSPDGTLSTVTAIVTDGHFGASTRLIESLPKLQLIVNDNVGVDEIDLAAAQRRGIRITTTTGAETDDVADMALALLLAVSRRIVVGDGYVRGGGWGREPFVAGRRVASRRVGILGLGHIGQAVAKRLLGFDMWIAYTDLHEEAVPYHYFADLATLAHNVQVLIVTAPGGPSTHGIVNRQVLEALGPDGILINVGRGSVVDQPALVDVLSSGRIAGAGLDVFADEPHVPEELKAMTNVVLEPHQAGATVESRVAMTELDLRNLRAYFAGEPLVTPLRFPVYEPSVA